MATYDVAEAQKWLLHVDKEGREATIRGLRSAGLRLVGHIQNAVIPSITPVPVDRGVYRAGWHVEKVPNGAEVVNTVTHAMFIEFGVNPGNVRASRAFVTALAEWVRRKGIGGKLVIVKNGKDVGKVRLKRASKDEAMSIAWAIIGSMKKHGIHGWGVGGRRVLEKALKQAPAFIREEVLRELKVSFGTA